MISLIFNIQFATFMLAAAQGAPLNQGSLTVFGIFILIVGTISLVYPRLFWHLRIGRKVPGVEPSGLYLFMLRFGGLLVIALGLILIFMV